LVFPTFESDFSELVGCDVKKWNCAFVTHWKQFLADEQSRVRTKTQDLELEIFFPPGVVTRNRDSQKQKKKTNNSSHININGLLLVIFSGVC
jgi:hypothetical protein